MKPLEFLGWWIENTDTHGIITTLKLHTNHMTILMRMDGKGKMEGEVAENGMHMTYAEFGSLDLKFFEERLNAHAQALYEMVEAGA